MGKIMPRRGKIAQGGKFFFARASHAQAKIILPPLTNFSSTPLSLFVSFSEIFFCYNY